MKKIFAAAAVALFMMTSCSDDDSSSNNNNNTDVVLVKKTIETYEDGSTLTSTFHYNGTKISSIHHSDGAETNFTYTGNNVTKIEYMEGNELSQRNVMTYDAEGRLTSLIEYVFDETDPWADKTVFSYNDNNTITTVKTTGDHNSQTDHVQDGTITVLGGNITQYVTDNDTTTYSYDSKNSPEKNITGVEMLNLSWQEGGVNNITAYNSEEFSEGYTATYTYNSDNYPVTVSQNWGTETINIQYIYE